MKGITATDLNQWSEKRESQEILPLLLRRLILACVGLQGRLRMPAGDSIQQKGWDGTLETEVGNAYIPVGLSKWEMSVNKEEKNKVKKDYDKRTQTTEKNERANSTFIFVTTRSWELKKKEDWVKKRKEENNWKDIRVYDGIDLEHWLYLVPSVSSWFVKEILKYPSAINSLDTFWNEWSKSTKPPIIIDLILAGRDNNAENIKKRLFSNPSVYAVRSQSKQESIAFLYSVVSSMSEEVQEVWKSRALIVSDEESMRFLANKKEPQQLIVLNIELEPELAQIAVSNGHFVFIPLGPEGKYGERNSQEVEELEWLYWEPFVNALKKMGLTEEEAEKLARESGRSITVLRRLKISSPIIHLPVWALPENAREIIPALLAGSWEENVEGDKEIISEIAGSSYDDVRNNLIKWVNVSDSPLQCLKGSWKLTSAIDTWLLLFKYLTENDLERLRIAIMKVLGITNPLFELEPDKRWGSELFGKKALYSESLRRGLAQSLAVLASYSDKFDFTFKTSPKSYVSSIVHDLLHNADGIKWCSVEDVLPILAEASPDNYLEAVEDSLSKNKPPIMNMFSEEGFFGGSPHTGLLWALEALAWSPTYLSRVTLILGHLMQLDPGGKLTNRPQNTLREIYCIWVPQTYATFEQKVDAIKLLLNYEPIVGWKLLVDIIPRRFDCASPTYAPKWRDFKSLKYGPVTQLEIFNNVRAIAVLLKENIDCDENYWLDIIDKLDTLPSEDRSDLLNILEKCVRNKSLSEGGLKILDKLREILFRNRTFKEEPVSLTETSLERIEEILKILQKDSVLEKYKWLFDDLYPRFPEGRSKEFDIYEKQIQNARSEAIQQIIQEKGFNGIFELSKNVKYPYLVGISTAYKRIENDQIKPIIRTSLQADDESLNFFGMAFISIIQSVKGESWVEEMSLLIKEENWHPQKIALFLLGLNESMATWKRVSSFGEEVDTIYWSKLSPHILNLNTKEKLFAIGKLLNVKRPLIALNLISSESEDISTEELIKVLENITKLSPDELKNINQMGSFSIEQVFQQLYKREDIDRRQIGKLEWFFIPLLRYSEQGSLTLHDLLSEEPNFFAEVICLVYRPREKETETETETEQNKDYSILSEQEKIIAENAWNLLHSWKKVPGLKEDGEIDGIFLNSWIEKAREICLEKNRLEIADLHIGMVLSHAPADKVGNWPPAVVCKVIETIKSEEIHSGFSDQLYNNRGVISKGIYEGGGQERELAEKYSKFAKLIEIKWPQTASILLKIAEDYEEEAKREDTKAKKRNLGY